MPTNAVSTQNSAHLLDLLGGDTDRMLRVLRAFRICANNDLLELDGAIRDGDAQLVRHIARRLAMSCHLVGESVTGTQLDVIAKTNCTSAVIDPVMTQHIARARTSLIESLARVSLQVEAAGELD